MDGLIQLLTDNPTLLAIALVLVAVGGLHAGETDGKAGTVSFSTAGGVLRLSNDD